MLQYPYIQYKNTKYIHISMTNINRTQDHLIDPKNDVLFKLMFGRECNKDLTLDLLNSVMEGLTDPVEDIEYLQSEKEVGMIVPGSSRIDLSCITKNKHKFTAEMQKSRKDFFIERCMIYNALVYVAQKDSKKRKRIL